MPTISELAPKLAAARSVILTTHSGPDGDGLGCIAALGEILEAGGWRVLRVLPEGMPGKYRFLDPEGSFHPLAHVRDRIEREDWDLAIVLDTHQWSLLKGVGDSLKEAKVPTVFLDHHPQDGPDRPEVYGSCDAVATGVLVYHLIVDEMKRRLTPAAAEALYVSISFDTNSFKYIRSCPESLLVGAELLRVGVDSTRVYRNLFASNPLRKARLLGWVLTSAEFLAEGRLAYVVVPHSMVQSMALDRDDLRDSVNHLLEIDGVEIAVTLKETEPGEVKISLRSKGTYVINGVAASLGGGGHALAAGCELVGPLEDVFRRVTDPLTAILSPAN